LKHKDTCLKISTPFDRLLLGLFCAALILPACRNRRSLSPEMTGLSTATFVGPWLADAVDVTIISKNGSGQDDALHFESKALAAAQGRKPTLTLFAGDGSYREETYNLHDSLVTSKVGFWHFYADTLYMRMDVEGSPKIGFKTELQGNGLRLLSKIDWDGDQVKDDQMAVLLKRPSR
jgi:hypothetical protein